MKHLIKNIGTIAGILEDGSLRKEGAAMDVVGTLDDAYIAIEDGKIAGYGPSGQMPDENGFDTVTDARKGFVLPSFCDSHSHVVYAGSRDGEFLDKINGLSYEEIARRGGGILNSADLLHETSEDELKMLRVIKRIKETVPIIIRATFLGAHDVGRAYRGRQDEYVKLVCREMIPAVAAEGLADFVDVFCDQGFFTVEETQAIMEAGARYGMRPKIHANELAVSGGVQAGVRHNALSVDHLERTTEAEIEALKGSATMPTMLPGASFFLGMPYGAAKDYVKAGLGVALASDYNPGSSPSGNMRFVMALGCIKMKLTPNQALNACTLNTAYAMGISDMAGSVTKGKVANLLITAPMPSLAFLPYSHQTPLIKKVIVKGNVTVD